MLPDKYDTVRRLCCLISTAVQDVQAIREVLQTPEKVRLLQHARQPTLATFLLLSRHTGPTWPGLLSMLSQNCGIKEVLEISRLVRDAYNLGASVSALQKTATRQALHTLHDRFIRRYSQVSVQDRALLLEAEKFVALRGHSSISALQHHFKIGYTSAAHLFQLLNLRAGHS